MSIKQDLMNISRYTFGTGDVGLLGCDEEAHSRLVLRALDAGVWFHSAPDYGGEGNAGGTGKFMSQVFRQAGKKPKFILKLYHDNPDDIRRNLEETLNNFDIPRIDMVQMISYYDFSDDWRQQGVRYQEMIKLKEEGLIGNIIAELYAGYDAAMSIVQDNLVDGYIFYYALAQCNIDKEVLEVLDERGDPIIALRTLSHIFPDLNKPQDQVHREIPVEFMQALRPLFLESGCNNWLDFSVNYILSLPNVVSTIGSTTSISHLENYLTAVDNFTVLPGPIIEKIRGLQKKWL